MPAQLGQLKTGQDGEGLSRIHLWCPDDLAKLWDRIDAHFCILLPPEIEMICI